MSPQQKIAERIYELLPHKKELEFGCEIQVAGETRTVIDRLPNGDYRTLAKDFIFIISKETLEFSKIIKVIGQPIRLADILMAMNINSTDKRYLLSVSCNFMRIEFDGKAELYNLSKDNILYQSDEFCEFLLELLK